MSRIILAVAFVLSSGLCLAHSEYFVLPPEKGKALLRQCSRTVPEGVKSFWTPQQPEIAEMEKRLELFLKTREFDTPVLSLERFNRQYIGFVKGGKRYIYGNFYVSGFHASSEATSPVVVCDGGSVFWGIVYSVEKKTFNDLQKNGEA